MRSGKFLGRNPLLSKGLNISGFLLAGALYFANIHFSAVRIRQLAEMGGGAGIPAVLAQGDLAALVGRYVGAISVSLIATIMVGILLHPSGLASFVEEVRAIRGASGSKVAGALVVTLAALVLLAVGFALYTYDFWTTAGAFGLELNQLFTLAAVPVWVFVLGPEMLFFGTNMHGQLLAGQGSSKTPGGLPPGVKLPGMPPAGMPPAGMPPGAGQYYTLKR